MLRFRYFSVYSLFAFVNSDLCKLVSGRKNDTITFIEIFYALRVLEARRRVCRKFFVPKQMYENICRRGHIVNFNESIIIFCELSLSLSRKMFSVFKTVCQKMVKKV